MHRRVASAVLALASTLAIAPSAARADVQHTVARGHTIEAIANRYRVSAKVILEANKLKDGKHLHPGDVLTIPTKDSPAKAKSDKAETKPDTRKGSRGDDGDRSDGARGARRPERSAKLDRTSTRETTSYAMKAKTPGVVHARRLATHEEFEIRVADRRGRVAPAALKSFEKMMRSPSGMAHPIEPRLAQLLAVVSNHFGSRKIEVVSGFRPFTPTQFNPHSNHMHGKAIDFRVAGVPNEAVRDFCRTLKNVGCGYYPNSVFVHMDVRDQSAFWIDFSKPGEPPRYNAPNTGADEGASDVHEEVHPATGAVPESAAGTATPEDASGKSEEPKSAPEAATAGGAATTEPAEAN